ncbi:hypothetical protein [Natronobeatus ordinarius]|uniref:hypothetical protein n=1 Tax=Natronobeatus ordinarius TaxID=2963433 RepID=UPI0020CE2103|nr:hypothetical protein [Natronobeatus ordinarius]
MTLQNLDKELAAKENGSKNSKNLRLREEYVEWIEQTAQERFGSSYKQARLVEHVIDFYRKYHDDMGSIEGELHEIKTMLEEMQETGVAVSNDSNADADDEPTPAGNESDDETVDEASDADENDDLSPAEKLEKMAHNGESIDPREHDLSVANGARGVDRTAILIAAMRHESTQDEWSKEDIESLASREMNYSGSGANDRANEVINHIDASPLQKLEDTWLPNRVDEDIRGTRMREFRKTNSEAVYRREIGKSLADYIGSHDLDTDVYFSTNGAMAQGMLDAYKTIMRAIHVNPRSEHHKTSAKLALDAFVDIIEQDGLDAVTPLGVGGTLADEITKIRVQMGIEDVPLDDHDLDTTEGIKAYVNTHNLRVSTKAQDQLADLDDATEVISTLVDDYSDAPVITASHVDEALKN